MKKRIAIFITAFLSIAAITVVIVVLIAVFSEEGAFVERDEFVAEAQVELTAEEYQSRIEAARAVLYAARNPRYQLLYTLTMQGKTAPELSMSLEVDATVYRIRNDAAIRYFSNENSGPYRYLPDNGPYAIYFADGQYYSRSADAVDDSVFGAEIGLKYGFGNLLDVLNGAYGRFEFSNGMYRATAQTLFEVNAGYTVNGDNDAYMLVPIDFAVPHSVTGIELEFNRGRIYGYRFSFELFEEMEGIVPGSYTVSFSFTALNNKLYLPAEPNPGCSTADCSAFW